MLLDLYLLRLLCRQEMSRLLEDVIEPVQDEVEKIIKTEFGLIPLLVASGVITNHQKAAVEVIQPDVCKKWKYKICDFSHAVSHAVFLRR